MRIGLIDVDSKKFPNLALMRISSWWKSKGADVEWWLGDLFHYDIIYKSKVFSDSYSKDSPDPINCDLLVKGGTGYAISILNGKEIYDKSKDLNLPEEIESCVPDYSIYPEYDFAVAITTRGCPRFCPFCHVVPKEGRKSTKVADVKDFWTGQKKIQVLDANITACKDRFELYEQYAETKAYILFNQGLDMRLMTDKDIEWLNKIKLEALHFAWDNPADDMYEKFKWFSENFKKSKRDLTEVYCLTNYEDCSVDEHIERALQRVYALRDMNYNPYIMIYDKPNAAKKIKHLQRYVNNKFIFHSCAKFEDYLETRNVQ